MMRRSAPRRTHAAAVLVSVAFAIAWCAAPAAHQPAGEMALVVTQLPVGSTSDVAGRWVPPGERYPEGSRVVLVGADREEPWVLSRGLWAAGAPVVSFDARNVLFSGKKDPGSPWSLFEVDLGTGRRRLRVRLGRDCTDPAYLAGGRIAFSCLDESARTWSLHVASRGSEPQRITFSPGAAVSPAALPDGRLLFSLRAADGFGLFTLNPDGTLLDSLTDRHAPAAEEAWGRPAADDTVLLVTTQGLQRVAMGDPGGVRTDLPVRLPGPSSSSATLRTAEPLADGGAVITARAATWGAYRIPAAGGPASVLFDRPDWDEVEAVPVVSRTPPRGRPSTVNPAADTGLVVCYDAGRSDGRVPVDREPQTLQVLEEGSSEIDALVLSAPLQQDRSFQVELPADRPLRIRTLDARGDLVATCGGFWVRPGEVRACFGCHEGAGAAPVNRPVQALALPPLEVEGSP